MSTMSPCSCTLRRSDRLRNAILRTYSSERAIEREFKCGVGDAWDVASVSSRRVGRTVIRRRWNRCAWHDHCKAESIRTRCGGQNSRVCHTQWQQRATPSWGAHIPGDGADDSKYGSQSSERGGVAAIDHPSRRRCILPMRFAVVDRAAQRTHPRGRVCVHAER